ALFRFWNMVQYFYPDRDVMANDPANAPDYWNSVLTEFIPQVALANTSLTYQQTLMKFIAEINDTHANLWSSLGVRPPIGACQLPVDVRFVEGVPLVLRYNSATAAPASGLMPGDVIQQLGGVAVSDLVSQWRPFYADSNDAARLRDMGLSMTKGSCGPASVEVGRANATLSLQSTRVPIGTLDLSASSTHDLPGAAFQLLSKDIAYLKLSAVHAADSANYVQAAAGTRGLIIDIRNYPSEFVVFTLGDLLVSSPTNFVRFTYGDITNPGVFHWAPPLGLTPQQPRYTGKVVILVDEITQSQAEYTTMAFRTAPGAIVIGSTTAGADGNVSTVLLPGGLSSYISGLGVFYPNNRPTQRVGIIPDIVVTPTIAGIRAGRDELIEEAIRQIRRSRPPRM
ncbi:MAG TPA: S41 family peptidase, partial [Bryobacteraceae bacterium]|nr:S41 family peptidase [Bryobacteraceae bacterium]